MMLAGETLASRKITHAVVRIACCRPDWLWLGNPDARRDWGRARESVGGMWRMAPGGCVLATHRAIISIDASPQVAGGFLAWAEDHLLGDD